MQPNERRAARDAATVAALKAARKAAKLSQRELAKTMGRAHSFVAKVESAKRKVTTAEVCEIAEAIGIDARVILCGIEDAGRAQPSEALAPSPAVDTRAP